MSKDKDKDELVIGFDQSYRRTLIDAARSIEAGGLPAIFVKRDRIMAVQLHVPFIVQTYQGPRRGEANDWLVTNHPDDGGVSDMWPVSDEWMRRTYPPAGATVLDTALTPADAASDDEGY